MTLLFGVLYHAGHGVEQDHVHANTLLRQAIAADSNNAGALANLGNSYLEGLAVEKSVTTALSFYQRAADLGHAAALRNIAVAYRQGEVGPGRCCSPRK